MKRQESLTESRAPIWWAPCNGGRERGGEKEVWIAYVCRLFLHGMERLESGFFLTRELHVRKRTCRSRSPPSYCFYGWVCNVIAGRVKTERGWYASASQPCPHSPQEDIFTAIIIELSVHIINEQQHSRIITNSSIASGRWTPRGQQDILSITALADYRQYLL